MIPLGDVAPRRTRPVLTYAVGAWLAATLLGFHWSVDAAHRHAWLWTWGGCANTFPWPALATAWWLEPVWLAGLANVAALLLFGPAVEDRLAHARFAAVLGFAAVSNIAAAALFPPAAPRPVAGAAGPVAAVLAAHVALFRESRLAWWLPGPAGGLIWETPAIVVIGTWALIVPGNLAQAVQSGPTPTPPLLAAGLGIVVGTIGARWLARPERVAVEWWDRVGKR